MVLVWRTTKPSYVTGITVILVGILCVLIGLICMFYRGIYGIELLKKHRYWPTVIYVDVINFHIKNKWVGMTSSQKIEEHRL